MSNLLALFTPARFRERAPSDPPTNYLKRPLAVALTGALALGLVFTSGVATATAADSGISVAGLETGGRVNPLGLPTAAPTFSWHSASSDRGVLQTAYEVRVSDDGSKSGNVWSSGKVNKSDQINVVYAGPSLKQQTRYTWQVKVWDNKGNESAWSDASWFETGIVDPAGTAPADSAWTGDWISAPSAYAPLDKWSDYTFTTNFTLDSLLLGVYFRSPDANNGYMWQLSVAGNDGTVKLRPHKKVGGNFSLIESKDVTSVISAADLKQGSHDLAITVKGNTITTKIDGKLLDTRTDDSFPTGYVGFRQDNSDLGVEKATIHAVNVTAETGTVLLDNTFDTAVNPFTVGRVANGNLIFDTPSSGILDVNRESTTSLPIFRKEFTPAEGKTVESARIYAAARGVYELSLNGSKVGDQHLAPGWTDYNKSVQYQTYDVTKQLKSGANAIGAYIAPGWYSGNIASFGNKKYGTTPSLIAQLRVDYTDGTHAWVVTDPSWKSTSGPIKSSDIIDGETWDATAELADWNTAGFDDSSWTAAGTQASASAKLVPQRDEPVRQTEEKPALSQTTPSANTYLYDLGQNMVGVARLKLSGAAGTTATIRYGEVLNPDGTLYTANLRSAKATDHYTFGASGTATYEPKFTYHGYRYIEVTGVDAKPALTDITGLVWGSDLATTGSFQTSDEMLNQLQSNITWGQRGNFLSIPTDTPARDERLGWTGDINVFAPTASYNSNSLAFLTKWLVDLRATQQSNGDFRGVAPFAECCGGGTGWSDAMITVPYALYHAYGDTAVVNENYAAMEKFMDYMISWSGDDLINDGAGYLDWLHLDDPTPSNVLGTAYFAEDARMLSEMAAGIGDTERATQLATLSTDIRAAFAKKFIAADGTVSGNSQAAYAMAIGMGLVPADQLDAVGDKFVAKLKTKDYHLSTGFLGTPWLLPALSKTGHQDIAFRLLQNKDYPSWGYEIENGATTVWERWNSIMPDGSFGDVNMNSFNHYAYGAVGTWMYQNIGGITPVDAGYKKIEIAPTPGGGLTEGKGTFDSVYGHISSEWKTTTHGLTLDVTVPVNTTATVRIPAANAFAVSEGGVAAAEADGVSDVTSAKGVVSLTVGSGTYAFSTDARGGELGSVVGALQAFSAEVADLAEQKKLTSGQKGHIDGAIAGISASVADAVTALREGKSVTPALYAAADASEELRTWIAAEHAADRLDDATYASLTAKHSAADYLLGDAIAAAIGVTVTLPPVADAAQPGDTVEGAVALVNDGDTDLANISAKVTLPKGFRVDPAELAKAALDAGDSAQLGFTVAVPVTADSGAIDATLDVTFTAAGHTVRLRTDSSNGGAKWLTVATPVAITAATATSVDTKGTLKVTLKNTGTTGVGGKVAIDVPKGWPLAVSSKDIVVAAGDTVDVTVPFFVPTTVDEGAFPITASFVRGAAALDTREATLDLDLATPPTESIDHVDLGDNASEAAHGIMASPSSGTNTEAGYTRRYSNASTPGSWFSFTMKVEKNQPFILRFMETYDSAATKKYDVLVNDTVVHTRVHTRTASGLGTQTAQVLIPDDGTLTSTGEVRIKLLFTTESGFHDPSIADAWTIKAPANEAPVVAANATAADAPTGTNGWLRGPATVAVTATDDSNASPKIETNSGTGSDWATYTAPIEITAEGESTIGYRATDSDGATSDEQQVVVKVDTVAPATEATAVQSTKPATLDTAKVTFAATDATSGVASTTYRVDGGAWKTTTDGSFDLTGFGTHEVEFFSTDAAGNSESPSTIPVTITDVTTIAVVTAPTITGTVKLGKTLTASTGSWNTTGLTYSYKWLRNGNRIAGATSKTWVVRQADSQKKLSVQVTAVKTGLAPVASTSKSVTAPKITALKATSKPKISGTARVGSTLTASAGKWSVGSVKVTYQWLRDGKAISGATSKKYKLTSVSYKHKISVKVTATRSLFEPATSTSAKTKTVTKK